MRVLGIRRGFQADHSSSSYLFYAVERPVSAEGQRIAHRYSSRADVDTRSVRYQKWGDSDLAWGAREALLGAHYDLMVSESFDWWTLAIALPANAATRAMLAPFEDARGGDDQGVSVEKCGGRLVVNVFCRMDGDGPAFANHYGHDALEAIVGRLKAVRKELLAGKATFLQAVADLYAFEEDDGPDTSMTKAELLAACREHGVIARAAWTKAQIAEALAAALPPRPPRRAPRLSRAARELVDSMDASS